MGAEIERSQTFVEWVLALLEERFPWLGSGQDEPVGGADTVDELADLYKSLIEQRDNAPRENGDPRA
jgi:cytochrome P450